MCLSQGPQRSEAGEAQTRGPSVLSLCLFVWFDSLRPINNLSVIKGRVFQGWTSTKLGLMFLLKDTTQWRRWGSNRRPFGLESSTLPLSHCAPRSWVKHSTTEPLHSLKAIGRPKFSFLVQHCFEPRWFEPSFSLPVVTCHLLINFASSFDQDQDRQNVGPDPGSKLIVFLKEILEKVNFEKSQITQQTVLYMCEKETLLQWFCYLRILHLLRISFYFSESQGVQGCNNVADLALKIVFWTHKFAVGTHETASPRTHKPKIVNESLLLQRSNKKWPIQRGYQSVMGVQGSWLETEGPQVRATQALLCCVLEQDTFILA